MTCSIRRRLSLVLAVSSALLLVPIQVAGQARIARVTKGLERIQGPTQEAELIRIGSLNPQALQEGTALEVDDEVRSVQRDVILSINCGSSVLELEGPFRALINNPDNRGTCFLQLNAGGVQVIGDSTTVRAGEVVAGARRTQYGVQVVRGRRGVTRSVAVFEGAVSVRKIGSDPVEAEGGTMVLTRDERLQPERLGEETIQHAAQVYARVDVSSSLLSATAAREAYNSLRQLHSAVLSRGSDDSARLNLAASQVRNQVSSRSVLYHLNRAAGSDTATGQRAATVAWLKGAAYRNLGDSAAAQRYYQKATRIDPTVERRVTERYRINPEVLKRSVRVARPYPDSPNMRHER